MLLGALIGACATLIWFASLTKFEGLRKAFLDVPNERSSHSRPVPRAGGVAAAFVVSIAPFATSLSSTSGGRLAETLRALSPGISLSLLFWIGLIDDRRGLSAKVRLLVQLLAALVAVLGLDWAAAGPSADVRTCFVMGTIAFVLVAATNLVNFADGINGLCGSTLLLGFLALVIFFRSSLDASASLSAGAVIGSLPVFLYFNMFRGSVFMGDVGSTTLGFALTLFTCRAWFADPRHASSIATLQDGSAFDLLAFAVGLVTLMVSMNPHPFLDCGSMLVAKRLVKVPAFQPHREHWYQRLSRSSGSSHAKVTALVSMLQIGWVALLFASGFPEARMLPALAFVLTLTAAVCFFSNERALKLWKARSRN